MDLHHFPPDQNYDCVQCGRSCQAGWDIPVEDLVRQQLEGTFLSLRVIQQRGSAFLEKKGGLVLNMTPENPRCGFLEDDLLCGVHRHLGVQAKPNTCRLFPYILTRTPDGVFAGLSFSCTAVRQNQGRPMSQQSPEVNELLKLGTSINQVGQDGLVVHGNWFTGWQQYREWEEALLRRSAEVGLQGAVAEFLCRMAGQVASWGKPRSTGPKPVPQSFWLENEVDLSRLPELRREMWQQLRQHFPPELAGVEPAVRQEYAAATALLPDTSEVWDWPGLERYLQHLVFRKQLVMHPTLLSNLCLVHFLPTFLGNFAQAFARHRGREVQDQDYWDALDLAEKFLVYHCRGLRPIYQRWARLLVDGSREG